MNTNLLKGVVCNGRIEVGTPIDLPDGTELLIPLPEGTSPLPACEPERHDSPEAIAAWLAWFDALPTLTITAEEEADTAAWRQKMDAHAIAQMKQEVKDLFR
jgi:hypothetical protein